MIFVKSMLISKLDEKGLLKLELVYLRLGHIYLRSAYCNTLKDGPLLSQLQLETSNIDESSAMIARNMYLNSCNFFGSSQGWLGVGRASFALRQYGEADDAFSV